MSPDEIPFAITPSWQLRHAADDMLGNGSASNGPVHATKRVAADPPPQRGITLLFMEIRSVLIGVREGCRVWGLNVH